MHDLIEELLEQAKFKKKEKRIYFLFMLFDLKSLTSPFSLKCMTTSSLATVNLLLTFANS
jgi:hypothetical protein